MLKESYSHISFPLEKQDPEFVSKKYFYEFGINEIDSDSQIQLVFAHALRDYLIGKISEDELGSLCFFFVSDKRLFSLIPPKTDFHKYISDCVDVSWLSKSRYFGEYKIELQKYLDSVNQKI